jgi:hypothetical protein
MANQIRIAARSLREQHESSLGPIRGILVSVALGAIAWGVIAWLVVLVHGWL